MLEKGFDAEKYIEEQSKYILERINQGHADGNVQPPKLKNRNL